MAESIRRGTYESMKRLLPILLLVFSVGVGAETISHTFPSGDKYVGEVKNGKFHGQGTYTWVDGKKYVGEWVRKGL